MATDEVLTHFGAQFDWQPEIEHAEALRPRKNILVCGMGGSHLGAWLIRQYGGVQNLYIHRDYGMPDLPPEILGDCQIILSSYSGGTEEVLDSGRVALERGLPMACIASGGRLIEFAREHALPHVVIPDSGLQPRMATGFSMLGIAKLMGDAELEAAIRNAGIAADPLALKAEGERLSAVLSGKIPVIYSSNQNFPLAYIWKIKLNETAKIPAFCNAVPEMNHNELCGFDVYDSTRDISRNMCAIFFQSGGDHVRVQKRMEVAGEVLTEKGIQVERVKLQGSGFEKAFNAALLADWTSLCLAHLYGVPDMAVPMVEDFKKRIA